MGLEVYLLDAGKVPGIGPERGARVKNGISKYTSPFGSTRYVAYAEGQPVCALQVVSRDKRLAVIANVYTIAEARRMGWASLLLARARQDFKKVEHASKENLSELGEKWMGKVG